mmetsp:Transcript_7285/g.13620  ORF Transcript_7285/g.13620 Transcript_7285/m.13620 type:complete len:405 (-) Transcript_7285:396-1610(-)
MLFFSISLCLKEYPFYGLKIQPGYVVGRVVKSEPLLHRDPFVAVASDIVQQWQEPKSSLPDHDSHSKPLATPAPSLSSHFKTDAEIRARVARNHFNQYGSMDCSEQNIMPFRQRSELDEFGDGIKPKQRQNAMQDYLPVMLDLPQLEAVWECPPDLEPDPELDYGCEGELYMFEKNELVANLTPSVEKLKNEFEANLTPPVEKLKKEFEADLTPSEKLKKEDESSRKKLVSKDEFSKEFDSEDDDVSKDTMFKDIVSKDMSKDIVSKDIVSKDTKGSVVKDIFKKLVKNEKLWKKKVYKPKRVLNRARHACVICHNRKVRCKPNPDGNKRPCLECYRTGSSCISFVPGVHGGAKRKMQPKALADDKNKNKGVQCYRNEWCVRPLKHPGHCRYAGIKPRKRRRKA